MKRYLSRYTALLFSMFIASSTTAWVDVVEGRSFFSARPQHRNIAREFCGIMPFFVTHDPTVPRKAFIGATPSINSSVRPDQLAEALFGTERLIISGSLISNRSPEALLADQFGLSPAFNSTVIVNPRIKSSTTDIDLFFPFALCNNCFYVSGHFPITWTKRTIDLSEKVNSGILSDMAFPAGYMDNNAITPPIARFSDAWSGKVTFGQMQDAQKFGKHSCDGKSLWALSEARFVLGMILSDHEEGHCSISIRMSVPTGSRPKGIYYFEPVAGNGKQWEVGVGCTGDILLWEKDGEQTIRFFGAVQLMHLFPGCQTRSFDFTKNGIASRFVLLKEFDAGAYTEHLVPAINVTTIPCHVRTDIDIDALCMGSYKNNCYGFEVGYNAWIRSKEKVSFVSNAPFPPKKYGIKGIQNTNIFGLPSVITESKATVHGAELSQQAALADPASPVLLSQLSLDHRSAEVPRAVSHKLFIHFYYYESAPTEKTYLPFIGIGGEIEFEGINNRATFQTDKHTLSQWGVWLKMGFTFDSW